MDYFASMLQEDIKSPVVPEVPSAVLLANHQCELPFSLLHSSFSADTWSCTFFHFPNSLSIITLLMFLSLSEKGGKVKSKKARAPAEKWCESHFLLCTNSVCVLCPLSSSQRALCFWARCKSSSLREHRAGICRGKKLQLLKQLVVLEKNILTLKLHGSCFKSGKGHVHVIPPGINALSLPETPKFMYLKSTGGSPRLEIPHSFAQPTQHTWNFQAVQILCCEEICSADIQPLPNSRQQY